MRQPKRDPHQQYSDMRLARLIRQAEAAGVRPGIVAAAKIVNRQTLTAHEYLVYLALGPYAVVGQIGWQN